MSTKTEKTYTLLTELPKLVIGKCSAILPNRLQCWRAGEYEVTITKTTEATDETKASTEVSTYQLCRAHAQFELSQDKLSTEETEQS